MVDNKSKSNQNIFYNININITNNYISNIIKDIPINQSTIISNPVSDSNPSIEISNATQFINCSKKDNSLPPNHFNLSQPQSYRKGLSPSFFIRQPIEKDSEKDNLCSSTSIRVISPYEFSCWMEDCRNTNCPLLFIQALTLDNTELTIHFKIRNNSSAPWKKKWDIKSTPESQIKTLNTCSRNNIPLQGLCEFDLCFNRSMNDILRDNADKTFRDEILQLSFGFYKKKKNKQKLSFTMPFVICQVLKDESAYSMN